MVLMSPEPVDANPARNSSTQVLSGLGFTAIGALGPFAYYSVLTGGLGLDRMTGWKAVLMSLMYIGGGWRLIGLLLAGLYLLVTAHACDPKSRDHADGVFKKWDLLGLSIIGVGVFAAVMATIFYALSFVGMSISAIVISGLLLLILISLLVIALRLNSSSVKRA